MDYYIGSFESWEPNWPFEDAEAYMVCLASELTKTVKEQHPEWKVEFVSNEWAADGMADDLHSEEVAEWLERAWNGDPFGCQERAYQTYEKEHATA